ncbi:hypothetical protein CMI48_04240 [Candidatus Pacearchaeota archaeon]|nr:hypothetical protein [Candidatus Pacearchaeota archaeon]|tara:strand:+ start:281 stop:586 length:306 start_codon:yes stop_codon:yes gene_type:complete
MILYRFRQKRRLLRAAGVLIIMDKVIHYPNLKTVLAVEDVLKAAEGFVSREELKRRLPTKVMHQTLNVILSYLEERGMVADLKQGLLWIADTKKKEVKKDG